MFCNFVIDMSEVEIRSKLHVFYKLQCQMTICCFGVNLVFCFSVIVVVYLK